ncbi:MAG: response regulator [Desulfobacterales bacterium]|nr:MAG: response regulator [Desulfobacteraceae bacterium]UCG81671.1 MAG: response regulator [Desulfobacterales bacterium]
MAHASEKSILVVDDEPDVRNFLAACIEDAGFNVVTAVDGIDALEKIEARTPDLVTLDLVMPRLSGIELMRKLRRNDKWAKIPVIVITAHAHDEFGSGDIEKFTAFAARHRPRYTMEKPVTPARLVKAIREILDVEIDEPEEKTLTNERAVIKNMISVSDSETLKKIRDILNK